MVLELGLPHSGCFCLLWPTWHGGVDKRTVTVPPLSLTLHPQFGLPEPFLWSPFGCQRRGECVHMGERARVWGARGRAAHNRPLLPLCRGALREGLELAGGWQWRKEVARGPAIPLGRPGWPTPISLLLGWRARASPATLECGGGCGPGLGAASTRACHGGLRHLGENLQTHKRTVCHLCFGCGWWP